MKIKNLSILSLLTLAVSISVFVYVVLRSIYVPLHYDEILNYFMYAETGNFQPFKAIPDANNHLVSTTFNHLCYLVFGNKLIWMRFSNTIFFVLYFWYLWKFRKFFQNEWIANCFVMTVIGSFFLFSFFSMARGYSFSITFLIAGIFHLLDYWKNRQSLLSLFFICLFGGLAIWSNLTLLPLQLTIYFLAFIGLSNHLRKREIKLFVFSLLILFSVAGLPFLYAIFYSLHLREAGALYMGVSSDFYNAVWMDLPFYLFSNLRNGQLLIVIGMVLFGTALFFQFKRIKFSIDLLLAVILFVAAFVSAILLHNFFGVNYPQNRTAVHFVIVIILLFFFVADQFNNFWNKIVLYPFVIFLGHSILTVNLSYHSVFREEALSQEHYFSIADLQKDYDELLTISAPGYLGKIVDHYNYKYNYRVNTFQESDYPSVDADILIIDRFKKFQNPDNYDTLFINPVTSITVLENKKKLKWTKVASFKKESFSSNSEYIQLDSFRLSPRSGTKLKIEYFLELTSKDKPCNAWLVVVCEPESKICRKYEFIELHRVIDNYEKPKSINKAYYFNDLSSESTLIYLYIWNIKKGDWEIHQSSAELYQNFNGEVGLTHR